MNKRIWILVVVVLMGGAFAARTEAFLGIGDVVFDPSVYAQAVQQVIRLEQQSLQLLQNYEMLQNQYKQLLRNAERVPVDMMARYRALTTGWTYMPAADTYGTTADWIRAATTGQRVAAGYAASTEQLLDYGDGLGRIPMDQRARVKASYGTVELTDAATQDTLDLIGRLRANAPATQVALQGLEQDSLSESPDMNTEVAVLNKINAAGLMTIHSSQDTNQLLITLAENQALESKRLRDAEARAINQHIRFVSEGQAATSAQAAGTSDAMMAFRMP